MKSFRKFLTILLVMVLVLESFSVAALATTPKSTLSATPTSIPEDILAAVAAADTSSQERADPEQSTQEAEILSSGPCGDNVIWTYDNTGTLTISGKGAMKDYSADDPAPWTEPGFAKIKHIVIMPGVTHIGSYSFLFLRVPSIDIAGTVKTIGKFAFEGADFQNVVLPEGVTTIGEGAFNGCSNLKSVSLPSTLKTIKQYAFACTNITEMVIPDNVTSLGRSAFYDCNRLEAVYISRGISTINKCTFQFCERLQLIILPAKLTSIKEHAFQDCDRLSTVYYLGTKSQLKNIKIFAADNDALFNADWYLVTIATKQPKDVTTSEGGTVKFTTAASRSNVKYQWHYMEPGSEEWKPCTGTSAKKATYSFTATEEMDGYLFCCLMTDEYGSQFSCNSALLTVFPAPKITKQPESAMAKVGDPVSVTVEAEGEELKYQWYYANNGSSSFKKASNTTNTYSTEMSTSRDGRKLYCVVKDKYGQSVKSETVAIYRETTPLVITQQPESVTIKHGEKATVAVAASGDGLTYTWYYAKAGSTKFSKSSTKTNTYSTTMNLDRDGMRLYCLIKDEYGKSVKTDVVTISMEKTPLKLVSAPESVMVKHGETATVSVEAEGDGLTYTWYYAKAGSTKFSKSSTKSNTYSTTMNTDRDGRQLYCIVKDAYGQKIKTDVVMINMEKTPLKLVSAPESVTVKHGETATVTVEAEGDGLTYTWYYAKAGATKFSKSSTKSNTYSTTMNADRDGRQLYCIVKDAYGQKIKTDVVTINLEKTPLVITSQPVSVTVNNGETASISVEATGDGLTYQWYYAKAGSSKFSKSSTTTNAYSTIMNNDRNGRQLYCVIKDAYGQKVTTETVTINMTSAT